MSSDLEHEAARRRAMIASSKHPVGLAHWRAPERAQIAARIAEAAHLAGEEDRPMKEQP